VLGAFILQHTTNAHEMQALQKEGETRVEGAGLRQFSATTSEVSLLGSPFFGASWFETPALCAFPPSPKLPLGGASSSYAYV
jgi:hypothetical protein